MNEIAPASRWLTLPALLALVWLAHSSGAATFALALGALVLALAALGPRWSLDRGRQIVVSIIGAGVAYTLASLLLEPLPSHLTEGWVRLSACALLAAAARFPLLRPAGGPFVTFLLLFLSALFAAETRLRPGLGLFPALGAAASPLFASLFLLSSLLALRKADPPLAHRTPPPLPSLALLLLAASLASLLVLGARLSHARMMQRARSSSFAQRAVVGFSDQMELGSVGGMLDSSTAVLRLRGPRTDYLRGAVFDIYEVGRWRRSDARTAEREEDWSAPAPSDPSLLEIQALSGRTDRLFLPLLAHKILPSPGMVKIDPMGVVKRSGGSSPLRVHLQLAPRERALPEPPSPLDTYLARRVRLRLDELASSWTAGASSDLEKIEAIEGHLQREFRYARVVRRDIDLDPVLDFLLRDRSGHCEYFASGLVLLARSVGVPARVVTGYRVAEYNALGGYHVVRERNAHAWVEAWIEGKWVTRDPTPEDPLPQNRPHETGQAAALLDLARVRYDEAVSWLGQRTVGQIAVASALGLGVLGWLVARGAQRRGGAGPVPEDERGPAALQRLLAALAQAGHERLPHEPLDQLARRLPDPEAAALLRRYEALRYGGQGDPVAIEGAVDAWLGRQGPRASR
jgi:hypothetical protein